MKRFTAFIWGIFIGIILSVVWCYRGAIVPKIKKAIYPEKQMEAAKTTYRDMKKRF